MEMPEKLTILTVYPNGYVAIYDAKDSFIGEAKAVPVPPHGDLIDRDGAARDLRMDYAYAAARIVSLQPVIIPAESPKE
jgi:hypothetical protein